MNSRSFHEVDLLETENESRSKKMKKKQMNCVVFTNVSLDSNKWTVIATKNRKENWIFFFSFVFIV